ncbi:hypothetical protein [Aquimarina sp. 2201CG5-10]|uniref:hypothetical protein n=1 Tax=Aquimarina callyspongiae TaxID=3098150 RepID=UPI002AB5742A|nr:hypothetical protein [Aquimarina sp. 2201CG5-10]MDY8136388.1 hypothetical protein [Aquimarina sp. 2201CG5-10]
MKTLVLILASLVIGVLTCNGQTTNKSSKSSTKVSVSVSGDTEEGSFYRSFAIMDMDENFRIKVRYMRYMENDVKTYLIDEFGKENLTIKEGTYYWTKKTEGEVLYEVRLKGNKLRINVDKELASDKLIKRFEKIGKELKTITGRSEKI